MARGQRASGCCAAVAVVVLLLQACATVSQAKQPSSRGVQVSKPAGGLDSLEKTLGDIGTGPSMATLQAIKDAHLMTPSALRNVLTALAKLPDAVKAQAGVPLQWQALQPHAHRLVTYLRVRDLHAALDLLRSLLEPSPSESDLLKSKDLLPFAKSFDAQDFLSWVTADPDDAPGRSTSGADDSSSSRRVKAPQQSPKPKAGTKSPVKPTPLPKRPTQPTSAKSPKGPTPKPASKPRPIGNDPMDPVDQLYDWSRRVKSLGGRLPYLTEGEARRRSRSLLSLDGSYLGEPTATATAAAGTAAGGMVQGGATRQLRGTPSPAKANPNLNVGFDWFKPRQIGVVFHVLQFRDKRNYLYPPQAYWGGDEPAKRLIEATNKLYKYSGTNIQFYLKDYRTNVGMHPYLDVGNLTSWQQCGNLGYICTCLLAQNNHQSEKFINVYVAGSQAYRGYNSTVAAYTSVNPGSIDLCEFTRVELDQISKIKFEWSQKYSRKTQNIWMSFDYVDPLQYNSAEYWNLGGTTLAHEFGHMLGLSHTFSPQSSPKALSCVDTDGVADTPPDKQDGWANKDLLFLELLTICNSISKQGKLPTRGQLTKFDSCPGDKYIDNVFNLMNYTPAACPLLLTRGQVRLMQKKVQKYQTGFGQW